jgi:hypothetical protein
MTSESCLLRRLTIGTPLTLRDNWQSQAGGHITERDREIQVRDLASLAMM